MLNDGDGMEGTSGCDATALINGNYCLMFGAKRWRIKVIFRR